MADAVKIEGLDDVLDAISEMADEQELKKALGQACALVEGEARKNAPKGISGDLRKFMDYRVEENGGELVGVVFNPLEYAPYVEYGTGLFAEDGNGRKDVPWLYRDDKGELHVTRGSKPHPFLRPALHDNREKILRILRGGLKK
jgi:HK97 gp10 family phage protein